MDAAQLLQESKRISKMSLALKIDPLKNDLGALLKKHKINSTEFESILKVKGGYPTLTELGIFSAMWSEHCSYKSSRVHLRRFPVAGKNVVVGPGENAGVVRFKDKLCVAFKMESHNHPSYIEPYQGAATGVGGILRDVFCMGARPIANVNCLRFGDRGHVKTKQLFSRVVKGIGDYGNCVGVPTVGGTISFDSTYNGNCLVNAMTVGLIHEDKIFKGYASGLGNLVIYLGSATGRDGIHGATMASDSFEAVNDHSKTTVQVGDPFAEKLLLEATLEVLEKKLVVGIQDMGAAGLTSSLVEMAGRAGNGVYFNLDLVPVRAKEMSAYEIMLSESQERMLMVIEPKNWTALKQILNKWQLAHAVIGIVTDSGRIQASSKGILEIDLPVAPLTDDAPVYKRPMGQVIAKKKESCHLSDLRAKLNIDLKFASDSFLDLVSESPSLEPIYFQYDRHIGNRTRFTSDHGGAAVLGIDTGNPNDKLGLAISSGCNERLVKNDPRIGSAHAVLKCARQIAATGGESIAITDCLNFGSPEDPLVMREFSDSVDGITEACQMLGVPVVSGNVSLYNTTDGDSIYPTPMIGMVGKIHDLAKSIPAISHGLSDFKLFELKSRNRKGSFVASLIGKICEISVSEGQLGEIDWNDELAAINCLLELIESRYLIACRDIGEGGAGLGILKMVRPVLTCNPSINIHLVDGEDFFGEGGPKYLLQLDQNYINEISAIVESRNLDLKEVASIEFNSLNQLRAYFGQIELQEIKEKFGIYTVPLMGIPNEN